jgi:hypothetical protein
LNVPFCDYHSLLTIAPQNRYRQTFTHTTVRPGFRHGIALSIVVPREA